MLLIQKGGSLNYIVKQLVWVQNGQSAQHFNVLPSSNKKMEVVTSNQQVLLAGKKEAGNSCGLMHPTDELPVDP